MCRLNMPKKDAKTETKDGPKKSMSEFVPTKEMKVMQKEDTEKMEETAFPTRQNNVLHDGTIGMAVWCLFVLAGITHLFQTGSSFMMNTNAKFGHSLVAQFFCVQMALTIVYIITLSICISDWMLATPSTWDLLSHLRFGLSKTMHQHFTLRVRGYSSACMG